MNPQHTDSSRIPPERATHLHENGNGKLRAGLSCGQIAAIVRALKAGTTERAISMNVRVSEAQVRWVRRHELARIDRALSTVRVGAANIHELVTSEQRDYWDEAREDVA